MASSVYYKFKSQRDESRVSFDGTGISVFDLKREIILANNLKANDCDLLLLDPSTEQEYKDDSYIIPRSSSVIAKRIPAAKPGKGKAAMYINGLPGNISSAIDTSTNQARQAGILNNGVWNRAGVSSMSKRFDGKDETTVAKTKPLAPSLSSSVSKDEESALAAMFQAQTEHWEETQEKMSHASRIYTNSRGGARGARPLNHRSSPYQQAERPLPPGYVCYRCGQKGHWIQDCPTNNDREYDHRPRIKRTTGIPRSFLKAVDKPADGQLAQGIMVTPEGGYVVAQPDAESWQRQVARPKLLTAADIRERNDNDPSLLCPIDNKLFREAVKTPCCGTLFCEECIQTYLLEHDFICQSCGKKILSLDKLMIDKPMRTKVRDYIEKAIRDSHEDQSDTQYGDPAVEESERAAVSAADVENQQTMDQLYENENDMSRIVAESIPQLQAQLSQLSVMLQNTSLPPKVRQSTQFQYQQLQMQLQQAQTFAALSASFNIQNNIQNMANSFVTGAYPMPDFAQSWVEPMVPQPPVPDPPYQRLPVNNRRRPLKRERPSDFLEVGVSEGKTARI